MNHFAGRHFGRKTITALASITVVVLAISGCSSSSKKSGDSGSSTSASGGGSSGGSSAPNATVNIGYQKGTLGTFAINLADELGYFKQQNITPKFVSMSSTSAGVSALVGGSLNFYFGGPEAMTANQKSNAGLIFLAGVGNTSTFNIVSAAKFKSVKDLTGQNFGVSSTTSISTVAAQKAFQAQGLGLTAVKNVVIGSTSTRYAALKAGTIACTTLGEPLLAQAREDGFNVLGYTDVDLGAPAMQVGTITSKASWVKDNQDVTERFLKAYLQAVAAFYNPSMTDQIAQLVATGLAITVPNAKTAITETYTDAYEKTQPKDGHINRTSMVNSAEALQEVGGLPKGIDINALVDKSIDTTIVAKAAKDLGIPPVSD